MPTILIHLDTQLKTNIIFTSSIAATLAMFIRICVPIALLAVVLSIFNPALAEESFTIVFKDHRIDPQELQVPAGRTITLIVDNQDSAREEFESHSLKREKVVPGKSKATIKIGPLKPGTYEISGKYHESTAKGRIVAK
jgi:plastocyanin